MKLDLRQDFEEIYSYLLRRVRTYDAVVNAQQNPGDGDSPITYIELGYECNQSGWVALVFDTRPDAEPDGEWTGYIDETIFERPKWLKACGLLNADGAVELVLPDGTIRTFASDWDESEYRTVFGEMLKGVLLKARDEGVLKSLPLAEPCHIGVEDFDGAYGWPQYEDRGKNDLA